MGLIIYNIYTALTGVAPFAFPAYLSKAKESGRQREHLNMKVWCCYTLYPI